MTDYIKLKRENFAIIEKQKKNKAIVLSGYPYWLTIDPTNYCNLRCPFCPTGRRSGTRPQAKLGRWGFKKIIDSLGPYLIHIDFCNWGEPLMNENVCEMIYYAKKFGIDTKLDTNLNIFDKQIVENIVKSGLDKIIVSIDGASQKTYQKYRVGGDFDKVMRNLERLISTKKQLKSKKPFVEWQFLVFRHNQHEIEAAKKIAADLGVDAINFTPPYAGNPEWLTTLKSYRSEFYETNGDEVKFKKQSGKKICNWLWDGLAVNSNGSISACCSVEDAADDFFGEFPENKFNKMWNSDLYTAARRRIANADPADSKSGNRCIRCDHWGWSNHMDVEHILDKMKEKAENET